MIQLKVKMWPILIRWGCQLPESSIYLTVQFNLFDRGAKHQHRPAYPMLLPILAHRKTSRNLCEQSCMAAYLSRVGQIGSCEFQDLWWTCNNSTLIKSTKGLPWIFSNMVWIPFVRPIIFIFSNKRLQEIFHSTRPSFLVFQSWLDGYRGWRIWRYFESERECIWSKFSQ